MNTAPRQHHPLWADLKAQPGLWAIPLALVVALALELPQVQEGPILCVFRLSFGVPCGGCGLTRATVALVHGEWRAALGFNVLAPLWWAWALGWWGLAVLRRVRAQPLPRSPRWLGATMLLLLAVFWAARLVDFFGTPGWQEQVARDAVPLRLWHWLKVQL